MTIISPHFPLIVYRYQTLINLNKAENFFQFYLLDCTLQFILLSENLLIEGIELIKATIFQVQKMFTLFKFTQYGFWKKLSNQ
jgi:hypothetical protein